MAEVGVDVCDSLPLENTGMSLVGEAARDHADVQDYTELHFPSLEIALWRAGSICHCWQYSGEWALCPTEPGSTVELTLMAGVYMG